MIKIENVQVVGLDHAIRGMRNPMNSWEKSDSGYIEFSGKDYFALGHNDEELALKLNKGGSVHAKYRRFIMCYMDITAPLYWWKEFDTYRMGVEKNSCSTMHKIHDKEFTLDDFSTEHLTHHSIDVLKLIIGDLNIYRNCYIETKNKNEWWQMIQLLPSSYNQKRTVVCSYESLANMFEYRENHKLDEWVEFCKFVKSSLPYSQLIVAEEE